MKPAELIRTARELAGEITGLNVENVTGFERDGDGWVVTLEVLELERVPNTMDLLGTYEIGVSDDGELVGVKRIRRYPRGASDKGD